MTMQGTGDAILSDDKYACGHAVACECSECVDPRDKRIAELEEKVLKMRRQSCLYQQNTDRDPYRGLSKIVEIADA
jgi:hypothetical protein